MADVRLIDANALKEWLGCDGDNKYRSMIMHEIADRIDEQPTIDAVPVVHGRWIRDEADENWFACSVCKGENGPWNKFAECTYKFCPWCGAKMDKEE
jgi:hypothetical protein